MSALVFGSVLVRLVRAICVAALLVMMGLWQLATGVLVARHTAIAALHRR